MMEPPAGLTGTELGLEPQIRARSNTWPLPRPDNYVETDNVVEMAEQKCGVVAALPGAMNNSGVGGGVVGSGGGGGVPPNNSHLKKNSSRRNAWGNLSYADLITQAIGSAPDKRLTLSQIYEWMVQNVAYFKDKGDSNSSAGWKNSIRHNLSLHNRFMRVQNEGTGKSSWWMINPDAKPGKSARRRATSMETSKFEKRRGRVKKKVEALRSGLEATPSPSSSVSESLDLFPESPLHGFQLSPDFRPRTSSNASSCGGRLSPIPAADSDWGFYGPEQLAGSLEQTMRLGQPPAAQPQQQQQQTPQSQQQTSQQTAQQQQQTPQQQRTRSAGTGGVGGGGGGGGSGGGGGTPQDLVVASPGGFAYPPPPPYRPAPPYMAPCPVHRLPLPCHACAVAPKQKIFIGEGESAATMMGQLMGALNPTMLDEVINIDSLPLHGEFDCNVDEVIKHELSLDGTLDFNFTGGGGGGGGGGGNGNNNVDASVLSSSQTQEPTAQQYSGHSWVH